MGESFGAPVDTDSLREITRGLTRLVGRERTLQFLEGATDRAGLDLEPGVAWFLLRKPPPHEFDDIRERPDVDPERFDAVVANVRDSGHYDDDGLTSSGQALRMQLVVARTDCLRELIDDWEPGSDPELDELLERLSEELARPPHAVASTT